MMPAARHNPQARTGLPARRAAFTMVEVIVVAVIMVVLAAVIVPRVMGNGSRQGRVTAEAVRDLLSAAGEREALTSQTVALAFDDAEPGGGRLSLMSAAVPGQALSPDPLLRPVPLDGLEIERCTAAGLTLNPRQWQIPLKESDHRPAISLILRRADGGRWLITLPSEAVSATLEEITDPGAPQAGLAGAIDLDQTGRRDEPW